MPEFAHAQLAAEIAATGGVVMLVGAPDTGKTTLAHQIMTEGVKAGRSIAYVDADVGQSTVGPPTCVGLRWINSEADLQDLSVADELRFVGSTSPERLVLQQVLATATLVDVGRRQDSKPPAVWRISHQTGRDAHDAASRPGIHCNHRSGLR